MRWKWLGEKSEKYRERNRVKWGTDRTGCLNSTSSKSRQIQVSRGIEISIEEVSRKMVVDSWGIEEVLRNNPIERRTEARSIHQVSRSYRGCKTISIDPPGIEKLSGLRLEKAEEAQQTARYRGGLKPTFKISFSRCEKHRHECNPTSNSTNDPLNILSSQNHLSIIILST